MDDQNNPIQEGEVVEETPVQGADSTAIVLQNLEGLIKSNIIKIDELGNVIKQQNDMIQSVLENDQTYLAHSEAAKQASLVKGNTKKEILKRPEVSHVVLKLQELKNELTEMRDAQSSYLSEYQRLSGSNEIETDDGVVRQIVYTAKLIRR